MKDMPARKHPRLKGYDYSQNGCYFITFCVKDRRHILGTIVGRDDPGAPYVELSECGIIIQQCIGGISAHYNGVLIDNYVIMPNHIHMIISVNRDGGAPRSSRPTTALIPEIIAALKKITNKYTGFDIWQRSYHDHIIRNDAEYQKIWQYINENPARWQEDCYYK